MKAEGKTQGLSFAGVRGHSRKAERMVCTEGQGAQDSLDPASHDVAGAQAGDQQGPGVEGSCALLRVRDLRWSLGCMGGL